MSAQLRKNNRTLLILLCTMWLIQSAELSDQQDFVPKLFKSEAATNYTHEVIPFGTRGLTITVLETNMKPALRDSAIKSLTHYAEIYINRPDNTLWETTKDMNHKYDSHVWLGAVNYLYMIAIGPYISVDINGDRILMFGVRNC